MKTTSKPYHLDTLDKQIIHMLMDNAKSSLAVISKKVGISTTAVHQRIKKMEQAGVIENSISLLNPEKIGYKVISYAGIHLLEPSSQKDVAKHLEGVREVVEAHCTTGGYSLFVKILCVDNSHLMQTLNKIQKIKGVLKTETLISLENYINRQLKI